MKRFSSPLLAALLLLSACSSLSTSPSLERELENPLTAERYYDELTDNMVNMVLQNHPLTQDEATRRTIDRVRQESLAKAKEADARQREGKSGFFVSDEGLAQGEALLLTRTLYLSPDFTVTPSANIHLFLSSLVDPRSVPFPDESAVDVGALGNAYGAQQYDVPASDRPDAIRLAVLFDTTLKRLIGFVQLQE